MLNILKRPLSDGSNLIIELRWADDAPLGLFLYREEDGHSRTLTKDEYKNAALWLLTMPEIQENQNERA